VGDSDERAVDKRFFDGFARSRERRDFEVHFVSNLDSATWHNEAPVDSLNGQVLPSSPDVDGMAFLLQRPDDFQGIQANCAIGPAVVFSIILGVILETEYAHYGASSGPLWNSSSRHIY
jgi:hypothetical protein